MTEGKRTATSRVLGIVAGVLAVGIGIYSMLTPVATYGVVGWLIAFALIFDGCAKLALWRDLKTAGVSDNWALAGGVLSALFGAALIGSHFAMAVVDIFVAYLVAGWLLVGGCVRIARSFAMRDVRVSLGTQLGTNWDLALVAGILMVVLGIFCLANPVIVMVALGWQIGFALVMGGLGLITATV